MVIWLMLNRCQITVSYYHVTYALQSESTLYSCLNVKELLARNRRDIWSLSGSNGVRSHNHLVCKWTLNHLTEWLFEQMESNFDYWVNLSNWVNGWVFVYQLSGCSFHSRCCHLDVKYFGNNFFNRVEKANRYMIWN